jgi:hypothetical protein
MQWIVPDCDNLAAEYERLKQVYAEAVDLLFTTGYQATDEEYLTLRNAVEEARAQSEIAGVRLSRHKPEHARESH